MRKEIKNEIIKMLNKFDLNFIKKNAQYHILKENNNNQYYSTYCDTLNKLYMFVRDNDLEQIKEELNKKEQI